MYRAGHLSHRKAVFFAKSANLPTLLCIFEAKCPKCFLSENSARRKKTFGHFIGDVITKEAMRQQAGYFATASGRQCDSKREAMRQQAVLNHGLCILHFAFNILYPLSLAAFAERPYLCSRIAHTRWCARSPAPQSASCPRWKLTTHAGKSDKSRFNRSIMFRGQ